jgi:segregation and condensation protein A
MYKIDLERFQGPLDLLLQLIEQEKLDITEVSLGAVTEQYLKYVEEQTNLPPEELADFLVIAAKLILIKSRLLLPQLFSAEDEEIAEDLTHQLAIYKLYLEASKKMNKQFMSQQGCYARERLSRSEEIIFSPPAALKLEQLTKIYQTILQELEVFVRPAPELIKRAISLKEKIASLRSFFIDRGEVNFHSVLSNAKDRTEVIVSFLALLELVKQRFVVARQEHINSHIVVAATVSESI